MEFILFDIYVINISSYNTICIYLSLGCYNKNTILLNNQHLVLTVLGAGKSEIRALAESVSGESPLPGP